MFGINFMLPPQLEPDDITGWGNRPMGVLAASRQAEQGFQLELARRTRTGRRGPLLRFSVAALVAEGVVVAANGGDCPLGGLQDRMRDPVPLFELVLPPRAARLAVPVLGAVTAAGILQLARRPATP
jgi:hypothetical protein